MLSERAMWISENSIKGGGPAFHFRSGDVSRIKTGWTECSSDKQQHKPPGLTIVPCQPLKKEVNPGRDG